MRRVKRAIWQHGHQDRVCKRQAWARDGPSALKLFVIEDQRYENQQRFERDEAKRARKAQIVADRQEKIAKLTAEAQEAADKAFAINAELQGELQGAGQDA